MLQFVGLSRNSRVNTFLCFSDFFFGKSMAKCLLNHFFIFLFAVNPIQHNVSLTNEIHNNAGVLVSKTNNREKSKYHLFMRCEEVTLIAYVYLPPFVGLFVYLWRNWSKFFAIGSYKVSLDGIISHCQKKNPKLFDCASRMAWKNAHLLVKHNRNFL